MLARVSVTLKSGVLDPQGKAIEGALKSLGFGGCRKRAAGQDLRCRARGLGSGGGRSRTAPGLRGASRQSRHRGLRYRARGRTGVKAAVVVFPGVNRDRDLARALLDVSGATAGRGLAYGDGTAGGHGPRGAAGRVLLRRLPALRRHRGALPGDGRGAATRRARRSGAGDLQRLPGGLRGGAAARRADAQRRSALRLPDAASPGGNGPIRPSPPPMRRGRSSRFRWPMAKAITRPTTPRSTLLKPKVAWRSAIAGPEDDPGRGGNPNGSRNHIAGIYSADLKVLGLMPHPENAIDALAGGRDGRGPLRKHDGLRQGANTAARVRVAPCFKSRHVAGLGPREPGRARRRLFCSGRTIVFPR